MGHRVAYVEEQQLEAGKDVILEIEIQGALKVKEKLPGYIALVCDSAVCQKSLRRAVWSDVVQRPWR